MLFQNNMKQLNTIVELLIDSQWHEREEINKQINLHEDVFNYLIVFLQEQGFIENENENLKITSRGVKFLDLPC